MEKARKAIVLALYRGLNDIHKVQAGIDRPRPKRYFSNVENDWVLDKVCDRCGRKSELRRVPPDSPIARSE